MTISRSVRTKAHSIMLNLWAFNDADPGVALFMTEFYRNLTIGKLEKPAALRQAMLTTMKIYPHPHSWAAFTLMGNSKTRAYL
jgi:CHAT domain-containing protein